MYRNPICEIGLFMSHTQLQQELTELIEQKQLTSFFQPIVSLHEKKIIGYEAFIRAPIDSPFYKTTYLFQCAEKFGLLTQLDFLCCELSLQKFASFEHEAKHLFINVSPQVLLQPSFKTTESLRDLEKLGLHQHDVIIELSEYHPVDNYELMKNAATYYRNLGFDIALDDLGAGYSSNLRLWSEVLPEYIKIDRYFIHDLPHDALKQNFIRSIQGIANALHCHIIAEGVETEEEFKAIEKIGLSFVQGNYLARPAPQLKAKTNNEIFKENVSFKDAGFWSQATSIEIICKWIEPISSHTLIFDVLNIFQSHQELTVLPLVDNDIAQGLIFREIFLSKLFSNRYGIDLYGRKSIKTFIDHTPLQIEFDVPIELVSMELTKAIHPEQAFIVTKDKKYLGVVSVLSLLEAITQQQIDNAKYANPLTLLPGSVPINAEINRLIEQKIPFSFGYFDLDHFKPFNDVYGYSAGDDIIKTVATTLAECVLPQDGIVGHIGGDDFIVIFTTNDWLACCENILAMFDKKVRIYYKPEDVQAGGFWAENRTGEKCFFPLTSLSVGLVSTQTTCNCQSYVDVADLASEAKKLAKKTAGSGYFVNLRNHPHSLEKIATDM